MNTVIVIDDATEVVLPALVAKATSPTGQREATLPAWTEEDGAQAVVWECGPGEFTTRHGFHDGFTGTWAIRKTVPKTEGPLIRERPAHPDRRK